MAHVAPSPFATKLQSQYPRSLPPYQPTVVSGNQSQHWVQTCRKPQHQRGHRQSCGLGLCSREGKVPHATSGAKGSWYQIVFILLGIFRSTSWLMGVDGKHNPIPTQCTEE